MKKFYIIEIIVFFLFSTLAANAEKINNFENGKKLFESNQLDKSKVLFERDIVFFPKNEKSYLYLAKIFKSQDNDEELETNLNTVLLLDPKNDEALYMLVLLKIEQSDYDKSKELMKKFVLVCKSFCSKKDEINKKFKKLAP
jgi:tetratricopeptide (TPR) repeat protein